MAIKEALLFDKQDDQEKSDKLIAELLKEIRNWKKKN